MTHPLYTLGYGAGWAPAQLAAEIQRLGAALWDIRMSPWSRSPQWRQPALRQLLGAAYVHVAPLGNVNYRGGPIALANPDAAIGPARATLALRPVVLLCGCADADACHRSVAAAYLSAALGGVEVVHLVPPAPAPAVRWPPLPEAELPDFL